MAIETKGYKKTEDSRDDIHDIIPQKKWRDSRNWSKPSQKEISTV